MTDLPYRGWCPICVQARGRQIKLPKQRSKLPIIQLDFGHIKGFDDSNMHLILAAVDIQSGMIVAIQLADTDALRLRVRSHTATALPQIERGRTTHTILQSDQEDFLRLPQQWPTGMHHHKGLRSIQFTITRRAHRTLFAQIRTLKAQIRQNYEREETSTRESQCMHHEQVCSPHQWMHKLLQQMEQRATRTTL